MLTNQPKWAATTGKGSFLVVETEETGDELWFFGATAEAAVRVFGGCGIHRLAVTGDRLLFSPSCRGGEVWSSDGTVAGTQFLNDETTGHLASLPDGRALLATDGVAVSPVLRVSDGTPEGTHRLAENLAINPFRETAAVLGEGVVFLVSRDDPSGYDLWRTDGTAEGTQFVFSFPVGWGLEGHAALTPRLAVFVLGREDTLALWRTDGSATGTFEIPLGPGRSPSTLRMSGGRVYFFVDQLIGTGTNLVVSDGSRRGTRVFALPSFSFPSNSFAVVGERVYWRDPSLHRLAISNLTGAGTDLLDLTLESFLGLYFEETPAGTLMLASRPGSGVDLWRLDGTATPQGLAVGCRPGGASPCNHRFLLPKRADDEAPYRFYEQSLGPGELRLWQTDGTATGTRVTGTVTVPGSLRWNLKGLLPDERQFLVSSNTRVEWFRTDGTTAGTVRGLEIGSLALSNGGNPEDLVTAGGRLFFVARDDEQVGVWTSDGTAADTVAIDVPRPDFSDVGRKSILTSLGNQVVIQPDNSYDGIDDLFVSDGTELGTRALESPGEDPSVQPPLVFGGEFVTEIANRLHRSRLGEGSTALEPLLTFDHGFFLGSEVTVGNVLYFIRTDFVGGRLWRTDGTAPGTTVVAEVEGLSNSPLVAWKGGLAALAGDRILLSDGTPAGSRLLAGPWTGDVGSLAGTPSALFFTAEGRLYRSDGTAAGTVAISHRAGHLIPFRDGVVFVDFDPAVGTELWVTESPPNGVRRVADLWPGPASSQPSDLTVIGDRLFFRASDGVHGWEVWVTDGTAEGTSRLTDLRPGLASSNPRSFTRLGAEVVFTADDGETGRELWAVPLDSVGEPFVPGPEPVPPGDWLTSLEVPGFRFKVRIGDRNALAGRIEPTCLAETVCVSGALPGRVEVLLRVVGPKPNGFLWPTLVKLTTSRVEIWIEQEATGEVRHYALPGAQGDADLPGLFDRLGFRPSALVFEGSAASIGNDTPPPTGVRWLTSAALPGFRVAVQLATPEGVIAGRSESRCLEETLCASGVVSGRTEVLVRVVGPRPNGFLWPTIARLTTSTVDVWIERLGTAERQHYRLEGAAPGRDDLTGLVDREGFPR